MESSSSKSMEQKKPHVVILPAPGIGHVIPLSALVKRLVENFDFSATIVVPSYGFPMNAIKSFLQTLPKSIDVVHLPPVSFDDLSADFCMAARVMIGMSRCAPALRELFKVLNQTTRLVALVGDMGCSDVFHVAEEFGILRYIYVGSSALCLSVFFELPRLDEACSCEYRDLTDPIKLTGCVPIRGVDLPTTLHDRKSEAYKLTLYHAKRLHLADGIILNSFLDLEPEAFKVLMEQEGRGKPQIYPIAPLLLNGNDYSTGTGDETGCLRWLDEQPPDSVLFVSFGGSGTSSPEQLNEIASGLEMSGQRFIWVVRVPDKNVANRTYYGAEGTQDPFDFLPKGFMERTKGIGLLISSWAPQIQILSHGSTGGFLSHCGWNSALEGIVHGVPFIAWPLYAEHDMIAVILNESLNVALRVKKNKNGVVERGEIAMYVRDLIEGEKGKVLRKNVRDLKDAAAMAASQDGSSTKSLNELAQLWKNHKGKLI